MDLWSLLLRIYVLGLLHLTFILHGSNNDIPNNSLVKVYLPTHGP